jgi:hypothetical protein
LFLSALRATNSRSIWRGAWILVPILIVAVAPLAESQHKLSGGDLAAKRDAWIAAKPPAYSFHLHIGGWRSAFLLLPRRIDVRDEAVVSATYTFNRLAFDTATYPPPAESAWTMDTVFDELLKAQVRGDQVRAEFDERWGYITRAVIDSERPDSDWELWVRDFAPSEEVIRPNHRPPHMR